MYLCDAITPIHEYISNMRYVSIPVLFRRLAIILALSYYMPIITNPLSTAKAHELWLEAASPLISDTDHINIDIQLGQMFAGSSQFYIPDNAIMLKLISGKGETPLSPRPGDRPAISFPQPAKAEHIIIAYESVGFYLTYTEWEKFVSFAKSKKATGIPDQHLARQLSRDHFKERYKRFAKTSLFLDKISGDSNDTATGMALEFVITEIPSSRSLIQTVTAQLLYQGEPLIHAPVTVFSRAPDGQVFTTDLNTDDHGMISLETESGYDYLLDHVLFRKIDPDTDAKGAVWETLWASHTFSGFSVGNQ